MIQIITKGPVLELSCSLSNNKVEILMAGEAVANSIAESMATTYPIRHHLLKLNKSERLDNGLSKDELQQYLEELITPEVRKHPKLLSPAPVLSHVGGTNRMSWATGVDSQLNDIASIEIRVSDRGRWSTVFESHSGQKLTYPNPRKMGGTDISNDDTLVLRYTPRPHDLSMWDVISFTGNLYVASGTISRNRLKMMLSPLTFSETEYRYIVEASAVYARMPVRSKLPKGLHHAEGSRLHTLVSGLHPSLNRTEFLNLPLLVGSVTMFSCFAELTRGGYINSHRQITTVVGMKYDDLIITWDSRGVGSGNILSSRIVSDIEFSRIKAILESVDPFITRYNKIVGSV